ncbi:endonuclease/exonuclease/phosphatase family protein [Mongoliibacter ruber]|uniref:Endonuclease/exonuclease/phosphatase family metal-dependent hydrolase n=1 Tax=Mongoliibacter ruber TaxID=1750599 RepID=A0A2T0WP20_9BACT|nr:endonuclease/exonuclease/phosphatase family protein [Mongoliibacter ruber]PRY88436.1 endonuclease/exonuclease/phosphatase family metal-dependent hydrolase [Mongoliibacter ruber]
MVRFFTALFFIISLILFYSVYISPEFFPYVGLVTLTIPVLLVINAILFFSLLLAKRRLALLPLIALALGWKFVGVTFQIPADHPSTSQESLSVLSYNVALFSFIRDNNTEPNTQNIIKWVQENNSDIKCFQEFYQDFSTPSRNAIKLLGSEMGYEHTYQVIEGNPKNKSYGMAIFSKYPIVNEGRVFDTKRNNGVIFADVKVNKDTIRIYNAHLESMSIRSETLNNLDGIKENYRETLGKLKRGQFTRATQLGILEEHMKNSPYVNILMGDFNDVPYSYTYFTLRKIMENAFESAGSGFGFTYNKVLFFLRIDNIFYEKPLKAINFKTHKEVDYSDHYPISATFELDSPLRKKTPFEDQ